MKICVDTSVFLLTGNKHWNRTAHLSLSVYLRVDPYDGAVSQHALFSAVRKEIFHRLIWKRDLFTPVWKVLLCSRNRMECRTPDITLRQFFYSSVILDQGIWNFLQQNRIIFSQ